MSEQPFVMEIKVQETFVEKVTRLALDVRDLSRKQYDAETAKMRATVFHDETSAQLRLKQMDLDNAIRDFVHDREAQEAA